MTTEAHDVERRILFLRSHKVMLDIDLASLYGVSTKRLNEQVKRNRTRFPSDFMFQLTIKETGQFMRSQNATGSKRNRRFRPYAFTEHGAVMLASVLNSPTAIKASVAVVRAFIRLREFLLTHKKLAQKMHEMERKYDTQFKTVFDAIEELMSPSDHQKLLPIPEVKGFLKE